MSAYDWATPPLNSYGTVARQCGDKRRYANKAAARRAVRALLRPMRPYKCTICGYWHLTTIRTETRI